MRARARACCVRERTQHREVPRARTHTHTTKQGICATHLPSTSPRNTRARARTHTHTHVRYKKTSRLLKNATCRHIDTRARERARMHENTKARTRPHARAGTCARASTNARACTNALSLAHTHTHTHARTHARTHAPTRTHARTHAHTHTNTHTHRGAGRPSRRCRCAAPRGGGGRRRRAARRQRKWRDVNGAGHRFRCTIALDLHCCIRLWSQELKA